MPHTRFLIACEARTGSNWLCGLLHSHPEILCHHEVFHTDEPYYAAGFRDGRLAHLGTTHERDRDPRAFVEGLWQADFGRSAVGFKLLAGQAPGVLAELLRDPGVKKLILRRESRVRAFLSLLRARETGRWGQTSYDGVAVRVDARELLEFARRYDQFYAGLRAATRSQPVLEVAYEDLQRDPAAIEHILRFLGVGPSPAELRSCNVRQSHDSLREAVANLDELARELRGGPLEADLLESELPRSPQPAAN
ncbi:MAG: sulfotransferase [Planctomycetes bacterium]|nr:sulfotransferase [Planctomycetota bacterium]